MLTYAGVAKAEVSTPLLMLIERIIQGETGWIFSLRRMSLSYSLYFARRTTPSLFVM